MAHKHQQHQQQRSPERDESGSMLAHPMDALRDVVERLQGFVGSPLESLRGALEPRIDVEQTGKELVVSARLPGYEKENVVVDLTEDSVTIRGRRSDTKSRRHGGSTEETEVSFSRSFSLPAAIRPDEAKATFKDGKLELRLPRAKETRVRRVDLA